MKKRNSDDGFIVTNETATPLVSGNHTYWDPELKEIVLQCLSKSHPNVSVEYAKDAKGATNGNFKATFRKDSRSGRELCAKSRSLEDPKTKIPESEVNALIADLNTLHKKVEEKNTDEAKQFLREYRVPDPREMRGAWRVARGPVKKLLLLWGYHDKGNAQGAVLPLTETSRNWDDAGRRVDLEEALREAGLICKSRLDWVWIVSRILGGLLSLLLLLLLFRNCDGCRDGGCVAKGSPPPSGFDMCPVHTNIVKIGDECVAKCSVKKEDGALCGNHLDKDWICDKHPEKGSQEDEFEDCDGTCGMKHLKNGKCPAGCDCGCNGSFPSKFCPVHTGVELDNDGNCPKFCPKHPDVHLDKDMKCRKCDNSVPDMCPKGCGMDKSECAVQKCGCGCQDEQPSASCKGGCGMDERECKENACGCGCQMKDVFCPIHPNSKLVNDKCPEFCKIHPDVHLDKDMRCRKCIPIVETDFTVRCKSDGRQKDGTFKPQFELESKDGTFPKKADFAWFVDGVPQEKADKKTFTPHFNDGSKRMISAIVSWKPSLLSKKEERRTPDLPWFVEQPQNTNTPPLEIAGDFSIIASNAVQNPDGSFDPVFRLESKEDFPEGAGIEWKIDGNVQNDAINRDLTMHFSDDSKHDVSAKITWKDANGGDRVGNANCTWHPGANVADVRRFILYVGSREDDVGTYYLYKLGSDPEDGKASVTNWTVEKISSKHRPLGHSVQDGYLSIHSSEIAGKSIVRITAAVNIDGKDAKDVSADHYFGGAAPVETPYEDVELAEKMEKAGSGIVPSVFLIASKDGSGTAFAVTKRHLVTNAHVIDSVGVGGEVQLYRSNSGEAFSGRVVASAYPDADLALVEIASGPELTALAIAESVSQKQPVVCVGFGVNALESEKVFEPKAATGFIEGYNPRAEELFSDLKAFHGNSGSPIANEHGQVIGVLYAGAWNQTADHEIDEDTHVSKIVTLGMLEKWLTKWGVRWGN